MCESTYDLRHLGVVHSETVQKIKPGRQVREHTPVGAFEDKACVVTGQAVNVDAGMTAEYSDALLEAVASTRAE